MLSVSVTSAERGRFHNEKIMKLTVVVGDYQQVHMVLPVAVLGNEVYKNFVIFIYENVDTVGKAYLLELRSVSKFKRGL